MKRHRIGRTDVYVSELGFGGAGCSTDLEDPDQHSAPAVAAN